MKSLKNTLFESVMFLVICGLALILSKQGYFPNTSEGVTKALMPISLVLGVRFIFIVLILYPKVQRNQI